MSLPRSTYDPRRVCVIPFPRLSLGAHQREILVYVSGAFFAIGWWLFIDSAILSSRQSQNDTPDKPFPTSPVHVRFPDWIPGICSTLGMIVVNLIDKQRLVGDDGAWSGGDRTTWMARTWLFTGFALMAGGLAGSVTVLVLKYVIPDWEQSSLIWWGISNVLQSVCIMLSAIVLWTAQNSDSDYEYNLTL